MKKGWIYIPLLMAASLLPADAAQGCRGCRAAKAMLTCDYYVKRLGDVRRQASCETYAKIVDIDGSRAKAAWYYLLAGRPEKALASAQKALRQGHAFAAEYAALASLILHKRREAVRYMHRFRASVPDSAFVKNDIEVLERIYKNRDFSPLEGVKAP